MVIPELVASVATFAVTTLWLGPCDIVYLWSVLNCFGLNFELWVQKLAESGPLARIEVSREGLGLGVAWSLEGVALLLSGGFWPHLAPSPEPSPHHPPGVMAVADPAGGWPSLPSVGCETPRHGCVGQSCPLSRPQFPHL